MIINKAFKFRIYPNQAQAILINKTIGCSRFVFNHFLSYGSRIQRDWKRFNIWYMLCQTSCHEERVCLAQRSG